MLASEQYSVKFLLKKIRKKKSILEYLNEVLSVMGSVFQFKVCPGCSLIHTSGSHPVVIDTV